MINCQSILVATDFSGASDAAVAYGRALARLFDAKLDVMHVVTDLVASGVLPVSYLPDIGGTQKEIENVARERLEAIAADHADHIDVNVVTVTSPNAANAIVEYAREHLTDLVIVGLHGRGGVAHLLLGSVAEKVVRTAPCPVLTVREQERDFVTPTVAIDRTVRH